MIFNVVLLFFGPLKVPLGPLGILGGPLGVPWGLLGSPSVGNPLGILGSNIDVFSNMFEDFRKTLDFSKEIELRAGERLVLEVRGGILGALGDLQTL